MDHVRQVTLEAKDSGKPLVMTPQVIGTLIFLVRFQHSKRLMARLSITSRIFDGDKVTRSSFTLGCAFVSANEEQFADKAVYCSVPAVLNVWGTQSRSVKRPGV